MKKYMIYVLHDAGEAFIECTIDTIKAIANQCLKVIRQDQLHSHAKREDLLRILESSPDRPQDPSDAPKHVDEQSV